MGAVPDRKGAPGRGRLPGRGRGLPPSDGPGSPPGPGERTLRVTWGYGLPLAWDGYYFFTGVALVVTLLLVFRRGAGYVGSAVLALAGLGAYEACYAFAFALTSGGLGRLVPSAGLPTSGWPGYGTRFLVELVVAGLAVASWEGRGLDSLTLSVALAFVLLLAVWYLGLGWGYPPFQRSLSVLLVNTGAEVTGVLWLPLAFTGRVAPGPHPSGPIGRKRVGPRVRRAQGSGNATKAAPGREGAASP